MLKSVENSALHILAGASKGKNTAEKEGSFQTVAILLGMYNLNVIHDLQADIFDKSFLQICMD